MKKSELLKIELPLCGGNRDLAVRIVKARLDGASESELSNLRQGGSTTQSQPELAGARETLETPRPPVTVEVSTEGVPYPELDRVLAAVIGTDTPTVDQLDDYADALRDYASKDSDCQRLLEIHNQERDALASWTANRRQAILALTGGAFDGSSISWRFDDDGSFLVTPSSSSDESRYVDGKLVALVHHGHQPTSKDAWIKGTRHDR